MKKDPEKSHRNATYTTTIDLYHIVIPTARLGQPLKYFIFLLIVFQKAVKNRKKKINQILDIKDIKHICHTKQPTYAYIQISLSRRKGGVSLVYPTSSRIWLRERKNPSSVWLLPLQPTARPPSQISGKCIRSNSMINNKINSLLQAKRVEIQKGQSCHFSRGHTAH